MRNWILSIALVGSVAFAQNDSRQASMRGSRGDHGKCTVEAEVDGVVEIEISGARANLHTVQGTPGRIVRFECNDALPRYPDDFKFSGVDGRGRQTLLRDPRENRGVALIRLEDPKGGREGYTFDIEWTGYANSLDNQRPGFNNNGRQGGFGNNGNNGNGFPNNNGISGAAADRAMDVCRQAVRDKANRDFGYGDISIQSIGLDNNPGRRDWITGRFQARRGRNVDNFDFNCSVDFNNGRVRSVDVRRW